MAPTGADVGRSNLEYHAKWCVECTAWVEMEGGQGELSIFCVVLHCIPLSGIFSQRIFFEFTPKVEHTLEVSFKSRNLRPEDSWHLLLIVVHPDHEGQGTHYDS